MAVNLSPVGGVAAQFFTNTGAVLTGGKLYTYAAGTTTPAATYTSSLGNTAHTNPIVLDAAGRVPNGGEIWLTDGVIYKFVLKTSTDVLIATYDNITGINSNFVNYTTEQEIQTATASQTVFNLADIQYQPGTNSLSVFVDGVNQYGPGAQYSYVETDSTTVTFNTGLHVGASVKFTTATQVTGNATDASVVAFTGFNGQTGNVQNLADDDGSDWIGFLQSGTGAVAVSAQDKMRQIASVKDFGAVGDGVTDDTSAIQAAIDSGKYYLYAPVGVYNITNLTLPVTGVAFSGAGRDVTKFKCTSTTAKAFYFSGTGAPEFRFEHLSVTGPGSTSGDGIYLESTDVAGMKCYVNDVIVENFQSGFGIFGKALFFSEFNNVWCRSNGYGINLEQTSNANNFYNVICQFNYIAGARFFYITSVGWFGGDIEGNFGQGLIVDSVRQFYMSAVHFEQNNYNQQPSVFSVWAQGGVNTSGGQKLNTWMTLQNCRFAEQWAGIFAQGASGYITTLNLRDLDIASIPSIVQNDSYSNINSVDQAANTFVTDATTNYTTLVKNVGGTYAAFKSPYPTAIFYIDSIPSNNTYKVTLSQNSTMGAVTISSLPYGLITIIVQQNATGGYTLAWNSSTYTTTWSDTGNTANKVSTIVFVNDGVKLRQVYQAAYA